MISTVVGIVSAVAAGIVNGSFATPMKRMGKWQWENTWLMWAVWALVIVPLIIALVTVPQFMEAYRNTESKVVLRTFLLGAGWGVGAVTFGLGLYMVGLSLGFSIIIGLTAVTGALIPMLVLSPGSVVTAGGLVILLGMVVMVAGVAFCGLAGRMRERSLQAGQADSAGRYAFKLGFAVCVVSGVLSAMLNLAFAFGKPIAEAAKNYVGTGMAADFRAANAIWLLALAGAFVTNLLYCGAMLLFKGSWRNYGAAGTKMYWFWAFLMGFLWMSGIALYGAGASSLGQLGTTVAWIILMATTVLVGNVWGIISGEWKAVAKAARVRMIQGLVLLIVAIVLVSVGNYLSA